MYTLFKRSSIFIVCFWVVFACKNEQTDFDIKEGDLFFQNTGTDEIDTAIKEVTATAFSKNYSHVGIAMQKNSQWYILEAIPEQGVCQTPLKKFLDRHKNKNNQSQTTVARLNTDYQPYISKAIKYGLERLNTPYDPIFLWDDSAYYCSELVYKMFATQNIPQHAIPFQTHPMTFNNSDGTPMHSWVTYYNKRNHTIPEGITGTNPNLMATSPYLKFVYDYEKE